MRSSESAVRGRSTKAGGIYLNIYSVVGMNVLHVYIYNYALLNNNLTINKTSEFKDG